MIHEGKSDILVVPRLPADTLNGWFGEFSSSPVTGPLAVSKPVYFALCDRLERERRHGNAYRV